MVELLVYIVLASIVVMIAGRTYVDSVRFRIATLNKLQAYSGVNEISQILQEDFVRIGLKGTKTTDNPSEIATGVYWGFPTDRSSFSLTSGAATDDISFKTAIINAQGAVTDSLLVRYWVDGNKVLWRSQTNFVKPVNETMRMMSDVDSFKIELGEFLGDSISTVSKYTTAATPLLQFFELSTNASPVTIEDSAAAPGINLYNFIEDKLGEVALGVNSTSPAMIAMKPNVTYGVELDVGFNEEVYLNSNTTTEYMALTLRKSNDLGTKLLPDAVFYTGGDKDVHTRSFEFSHSLSTTTNFTPVLLFSCKKTCNSSTARVYVRELRVWEQNADHYNWRATLDETDNAQLLAKARVRALRVTVATNKNGEITKIRKVIPTPNNGV